MSRVPSAAFLCALNAAHKRSKTSVSRTGVRQDKIFYVLNPDKNLANTQKRLEGQLEALGGEGKVGEHPSLPEMKRVLEVVHDEPFSFSLPDELPAYHDFGPSKTMHFD